MNELPRTYRTPWLIVPILVGAVGLGMARLLFKAESEDLGATGETIIIAAAVVFAGLLAAAVLRARTTVDADGVAVHSLFRTTRYRWPDIAELRVERADQTGMSKATYFNVCLYNRGLRRVVLPNVSDKRLGGGDELGRELRWLQRLWQDGRGADWQDPGDDLVRRDRRAARTIPVIAIYLVSLGIGMVTMIITLIISLAVLEAPQQSHTTFGKVFGPPFIFGVPAVLTVAAFVIGLVWRHRRRES